MPSIFLWKVSKPFSPTVKTISYYAGSNWFLEDYGSHSKSGMYTDQATLSEHGFMYDIQWMPSNWVGSYVLEQSHVPYVLIRTMEWGTLERIGDWMRFITKEDVPVEERERMWMEIKKIEEEPCLINITMGKVPVKALHPSLHSSLHHSPRNSPKQFHPKRVHPFTDVQMHV